MKLTAGNRVKLTRWLLIVSIAGSFLSLYTSTHGMGEVYPFFYWKLYTQPIGWDGQTGVIRIYAKKDTDSAYTRIPLKNYPAFSKDDVNYSLDYAESLMQTDSVKAVNIFKALARHLEPSYDSYRIVKEYYDPLSYHHQQQLHDDSILVEIH